MTAPLVIKGEVGRQAGGRRGDVLGAGPCLSIGRGSRRHGTEQARHYPVPALL